MRPIARPILFCAVVIALAAATVRLAVAQGADTAVVKVTVEKTRRLAPLATPALAVECDFAVVPSVDEMQRMIRRIAKSEKFPEDMLMAVARQESRFRMDAVSPAGAVGVMQLMKGTAERFGVDRCKPEDNILGAIRYLRLLEEKYDNPLFVIAAYNAGEGAVDGNGGIPPYGETLHYVGAVLSDLYGWKPFGTATVANGTASKPADPDQIDINSTTGQAEARKPETWSQGFVFHVEN